MKSRKFKWGNPLFVAFLAIAGIFGVSATVIDKQVSNNQTIEKADAWDGNHDWFYMRGSGSGLSWSNQEKFKFSYGDWGHWDGYRNYTQFNSNNIIALDEGTEFKMHQNDETHYYGLHWTENGDIIEAKGDNNSVVKKPIRAYFYYQVGDGNGYMKLYWSEQKCTITYNANGGSGSDYVDSNTYSYKSNATSITLAASSFTAPLQKRFTGWNTASNGSGTAISPGSNFEVTGDMTIYAQWEYISVQYSLGGTSFSTLDHNDKGGIVQNYYTPSAVSQTKGDQLYLKEQLTVGGSYTDVPTSRIHLIGETDAQNFVMSGGRPTIKYHGVTGYIDVRAVNSSGTIHYYVHARGMDSKSDGESKHYALIINDGLSIQTFVSTTTVTSNSQWSATTNLNDGDTIKFISATTNSVYFPNYQNTAGKSDHASFTFSSGTNLTCNRKGNYTIYIQGSNGGEGNTVYIERNTWTVEYDMNGHGEDIEEIAVSKGTKMSAPTAPTATGYTFGGWYKEKACTNAWDFANTNVTADTVLYAKWTVKTSGLTFNLNGGSGTAATGLTATYGSAMPTYTQSAPTKTGYNFAGFYDGTGGAAVQYYTNALTSARNWDKDTTSGTTLYAKWNAKVLTLTLNNQEATSAGSTAIYLKYDTGYYKESGCTNQIKASTNNITVPTKSNCTFGGYWTGVGGTGTQVLSATGYLISDSVSKQLFSDNGTLYAKWTFTIAYNANTGSGTTTSTTLTYGVAGTLATNAFTAPGGHIFGTWNTNSGGSGDNYNSGASLSASQVTSLANSSTRTLYAKWTSGKSAAVTFASSFNTAIGSVCEDYDTNTKASFITGGWNSTQEANYNALADYVKYWLGSTNPGSDSTISSMFTKYDYVLSKYGYGTGDGNLHDFLSRKPTPKNAISSFSPLSLFGEEDNLSTVIIIVASSVALLSVTALSILVIKKRKNKEE